MSYTTDKLNYLKDTKTAIKEAIISKGQEVTDDDTFRSYADKILAITEGGSSDILKYVTFMSEDGTTELFKMPVISGDDCKNPISHGDIETPTKESTNTQNFDYSGWSAESGGSADTSVLENITEDKTVYASFKASTRYYTVNFYVEDVIKYTTQVTYGADASGVYTPVVDGYIFTEWVPSVSNVTEDIDTYAQLEINDIDSWESIIRSIENGTVQDKYGIGYTKAIEITNYDGKKVSIEMELRAFDRDDLTDGIGKAKTTWIAKQCASIGGSIFESTTAVYKKSKWGSSGLRTNIQTTIFAELPEVLQNAIKTVNKKSSYDETSTELVTTEVNLWITSVTEMGAEIGTYVIEGQGESYFEDGTDMRRYWAGYDWTQYYITRSSRKLSYHTYPISISNVGTVTYYSDSDLKKYGTVILGFCI